MKDPLNRITTYEYDALNRRTKIIDPLLGETLFTYSDKGLLQSITDPKGQITGYAYNARGWLISTTNAENQVEYYTYDADGLLLTKTRRDGSVLEYSYDAAKQLTRIGAPDSETKFNYDRNGNIKWAWKNGSVVHRQYTNNNLLNSEIQNGYEVSYQYNATGTIEKMFANGIQNTYFHTALDAVNEINTLINGHSFEWTRDFDDLNRPLKDVLPNGVETHRTFTILSQLATLNNLKAGTQSISSYSYAYDEVGKRISKVEDAAILSARGKLESRSLETNYVYDDLDRLTQASSPIENFSYDVVGNRDFGAGTSYNTINQLLGDGWKYTFQYNLNGDMTKKTNLLTGQVTDFIWNSESQLMALQIKQGATVVKEIFYRYDAFGRRIERQMYDRVDATKSYSRKFFYDGSHIIEEQDLEGNIIARYMNGPGVDDPLLVSRSEGNFVFTKDGLGSIRELTKTDGTPIQSYRYSSYGVTTQELHENRPGKKLIENRYAYTGRELEDETGLYYYRARYYDPELGRFISEDPIGFAGGDWNLYGYVKSNPINWIDPSGLKYRRCSRPLEGMNEEYGVVRHDYLEFDDGKQYSFVPAPGESYFGGMSSNNLESGSTAVCEGWSKNSQNDEEIKRRAERNLLRNYNILLFNCQDFVYDATKGF